MQVEGCVSLGSQCWAAVSSSLTGSFWGGGVSVFSSEGTGPLKGKYQWSYDEGGLPCITKIGGKKTLLIVGGMNGTVNVLPLDSKFEKADGPIQTFSPHSSPVSSVSAFSDRFLSAGWDHRVCLHTAREASFVVTGSVVAHWKPINSVSWCPSGTAFISGGQDGDAKLWDVREATISTRPASSISTHSPVFITTVHENDLALGVEDGILIYDLKKTTEPLAHHKFGVPVKAAQFGRGGRLAWGADNGKTGVIAVNSNEAIYTPKLSHNDFVRATAWNEEGTEYISCGWTLHPDRSLDINVHPLP